MSKGRNAVAVAAHFRKASSFAHKCEARDKNVNSQREFYNEFLETRKSENEPSLFWENVEAMESKRSKWEGLE